MKLIRSALLMLALIPVAAIAQEDDDKKGWTVPAGTPAQNFYGGLRLGYGDNDSPGSNQDGSVTSVKTDENDLVYAIFGGYQFTDNLSVQTAYHDFGESTFSGTSSGGISWDPGAVSAVQDANGWELGILGRWPISERWYVLGFVGYLWWDSSEVFVESTGTSVLNESGSDVSYALGLEYDTGQKDKLLYRFMGSHHQVGDLGYDVNAASAEIVWLFP